VFSTVEELNEFNWPSLTDNFVIKPTNGNAGKGIVAFRKYVPEKDKWQDTLGRLWTETELKLHCQDILEGRYSTYGREPRVIIEERVPIHSKFLRYVYHGTPDVRVIVYNSVPVMAMLRLPTRESEGRANLSQGAIGVGIDMATGITTFATQHKDENLTFLPGTKRKLNGLAIPHWQAMLKTAVEAAAVAGLEFAGIDLFMHEEKGPQVVELNANPGLSIQSCNRAGLKRRLERVTKLNVLSADHGVRIAQALFAENFADKVKAQDGLVVVTPFEEVSLYRKKKIVMTTPVLINTGRRTSRIAAEVAEELLSGDYDDALWFENVSEEGKLPVVEVKFKLKDQVKKTTMMVSKKLNGKKYRVELGRDDLGNFLVGAKG
jgi:alpha-L-glutamate ligase-like protein